METEFAISAKKLVYFGEDCKFCRPLNVKITAMSKSSSFKGSLPPSQKNIIHSSYNNSRLQDRIVQSEDRLQRHQSESQKLLKMLGTIFAIVVLGAFFYYFSESSVGKNACLPPGPRGLPFFGILFWLSSKPHIRLGEWAQKYGHIILIRLVGYNVVVISDPQIAKEAFGNKHVTGKPEFPIFDATTIRGYGIATTSGKRWEEQRRFLIHHLQEFGFGKTSVRDMYMEEVREFMETLETEVGQSISLNRRFTLVAINSLWTIVAGKRFKHDDQFMNELMDKTMAGLKQLGRSPLAVFFPKLARAMPALSGWAEIEQLFNEFKNAIQRPFFEHKQVFNPGQPQRDFIDAYLQKIQDTEDKESSFYGVTGETNLRSLIGELFAGGSETTASTLSFAIQTLAQNPEIQRKLQHEIDSVVGSVPMVTLEHKRSLPYLEAIIQESLRRSSVLPFGFFHDAMETTTCAGYAIPKGYWVCLNFYHMHHNPKVWDSPETFRPERFLSPDGQTVLKNDNLMSFSVGRRYCMGESMARDGMFLILANIFHRFFVRLDTSRPVPSMEDRTGFALFAEKYYVILEKRLSHN